MSEIDVYEIRLDGRFGNVLAVNKIKAFTTKEEADEKAKKVADESSFLTFSPTTI